MKFYVFQTIFTKTHSALKRQKPFLGAQGNHFFEKNISSRMLILDFLKTFLLISGNNKVKDMASFIASCMAQNFAKCDEMFAR